MWPAPNTSSSTTSAATTLTWARCWPGPWYIHTDDLPLLDRLAADAWEPRTTLLSPFDNLICDRARTAAYVMPILHGDRLIGRVDQKMDRARGRLMVNAVYAEPDAPKAHETGRAVAGAIEELAKFLGARDIGYGRRIPKGWKT